VQLRSVTIAAVVAPDVDFNANSGHTGSYALRNVLAECAQSETCSREFPDFEPVTLSLIDQLNQNPISITLTVPMTVSEAVSDAPETVVTTLTNSITVLLPGQWQLDPVSGLYMDPNNPNNYSTGAATVVLLPNKSVEDMVKQLSDNFKEVARDVALGGYRWLVLEDRSKPFAVVRAALAEDTAGLVAVQMATDPATVDEVFAALWEPILSSVKVGAATK
jgi:hypothetical protein